MLDARTNLGYEVVEEVRKYFQEKVYQTIITRNVRTLKRHPMVSQSLTMIQNLVELEMYMDLAKEVAANG